MKKSSKFNSNCNYKDISYNKEYLIGIKKAILISLLENKFIDFHQYVRAYDLLEKNYSDN